MELSFTIGTRIIPSGKLEEMKRASLEIRTFLNEHAMQIFVCEVTADRDLPPAGARGEFSLIAASDASPYAGFNQLHCALNLLRCLKDEYVDFSVLALTMQLLVLDTISRLLEFHVIRSSHTQALQMQEKNSESLLRVCSGLLPFLLTSFPFVFQACTVFAKMADARPEDPVCRRISHLLLAVKKGIGEIKTNAPTFYVGPLANVGVGVFQIALGAGTQNVGAALGGAFVAVKAGLSLIKKNSSLLIGAIQPESWYLAFVEMRRMYYAMMGLSPAVERYGIIQRHMMSRFRSLVEGAIQRVTQTRFVPAKSISPAFAFLVMMLLNDLKYCGHKVFREEADDLMGELIDELRQAEGKDALSQKALRLLRKFDFSVVFGVDLGDIVGAIKGE